MLKLNHIVITANGNGSRMQKYPTPKFLLEYKGKPIIEHLIDKLNNPIILTHHEIEWLPIYKCEKTESRKETLSYLRGWKNVLIVDCDIYITGHILHNYNKDTIYCRDGINAGLYFVQDINTLLKKMKGDDINSGMVNPEKKHCQTIHLGTIEEYDNHCSRF